MATIVTRSGKGSPLTHAEVDANFTNLNTDKLELSGGTMTGNLSFGDNDKAIFGAGSDLQIYHDGSHSYISDQGTGQLRLLASQFQVMNAAGTESMVFGAQDNTATLYYDNSAKLATTSTGVDITGTLTSDGLTVDGDINISDSTPVFTITDTDGGSANMAVYTGSLVISADSANEYSNRVLQLGVGDKSYFNLADNGDISFREDTGTTAKFFWDASEERLGIGTSSPSGGIHILQDYLSLRVENDDATSTGNAWMFLLEDDSTVNQGSSGHSMLFINSARPATSTGNLINVVNDGKSNTAFVVKDSGNVGIGTSSPSGTLTVKDSAAKIHLTNDANTGSAEVTFRTTTGSNRGFMAYNFDSDYMFFRTGGSGEAARIDSNGNLLVGTTDSTLYNNTSGSGLNLKPNGALYAALTTTDVWNLNLIGSDGNILNFRKNGSTVGSIGVQSSDQIYIGTPDGSGVGLVFDGDNRKIDPTNGAGSNLDNAVDLGNGSHRFKDLYLSGGVYLGGTGSANKLDDYESGTWTPSFSGGFSSVTYSTQSGVYTKIGDLVICKMRLTMSAFTGDANFLTIQGLPFTIENVTAQSGGAAPMLDNLTATVNNITVQPTTGGTTFIFITGNGGTGSHSGLRGNQCTVNTDIRATIIYQAA